MEAGSQLSFPWQSTLRLSSEACILDFSLLLYRCYYSLCILSAQSLFCLCHCCKASTGTAEPGLFKVFAVVLPSVTLVDMIGPREAIRWLTTAKRTTKIPGLNDDHQGDGSLEVEGGRTERRWSEGMGSGSREGGDRK